ncbi:MAG: tetratricopeptide repeat protein [Smithellaceae bacterium]
MENNQFEEDRLFFINQMETLLSHEMLPEALGVAEERLARLSFDIDARVFINKVLIEMGRIEESRNILRRLDEDLNRLSFVYLRAADVYREKGLKQDAVSCYQKFLSLNPLFERSREVAGKIALLQGEEHKASEVDESDSADMPRPEFYTLTLADLYIKQGHPKMAAEILAEIIKREPANVQARVKLDTVKASLALKSSSGDTVHSVNNLIKTLSCWLENIGRLKNHAT